MCLSSADPSPMKLSLGASLQVILSHLGCDPSSSKTQSVLWSSAEEHSARSLVSKDIHFLGDLLLLLRCNRASLLSAISHS